MSSAPGDFTAELHRAACQCTTLINRFNSLPSSKLSAAAKQSLLRLTNAELRFLSSSLSQSQSSSSSFSLHLSTNVPHLSAILETILHPSLSHVTRACRPPTSTTVHQLDLVASFRSTPAWFLISARNPYYISWTHHVQPRVRKAITDAVNAPVSLRPGLVILVFSSGVKDEIVNRLMDEFSAKEVDGFFFDEVENGWVNVRDNAGIGMVFEIKVGLELVGRERARELRELKVAVESGGNGVGTGGEFGELVGSMNIDALDIVNFDTTALVATVSGISNGATQRLLEAPKDEMRARFKSNYDFVIAQVRSEIQLPIFVELKVSLAGKRGIICQSVCSEFNDLVSMCGGPNEKRRAHELLNHLLVVPDSPAARVMDLPTTRKIAMKNKIVFGTGDHWQAPTLTANRGFLRAISQTGMSLLTIEHRPRALTGD